MPLLWGYLNSRFSKSAGKEIYLTSIANWTNTSLFQASDRGDSAKWCERKKKNTNNNNNNNDNKNNNNNKKTARVTTASVKRIKDVSRRKMRRMRPQVNQARNMSIGIVAYCIQNLRICMGKKTYRFRNLRKWKDFNKGLPLYRENRLHKNP